MAGGNSKRRMKGKGGYLRYRNEDRAEKNKKRRLARHMRSHPGDAQSASRTAGTKNAGNQRRAANIKRYEANAHKAKRNEGT